MKRISDGGSRPSSDVEDLAANELRERTRQQASIAELGLFALSPVGLAEIMDRAADLVAGTLGVEYAEVLELLPDGKALQLMAGVGWHEGLVGKAIVDADLHCQAGYTLVSNGPVIVCDLRKETRFNASPLLCDWSVVSGMSTIIVGRGGKPYGVLGAHSVHERVFSEDDVHFIQAVANIVAMAVERSRVEAELRLYREVFMDSMDAVAIVAPDGRYVEQNRAHQELTGYSASELVGQTPAIHLGEETYARVEAELAEIGQFHGEMVSTTKDGRTVDVDFSAYPVFDASGKLACYVDIKRDITERKRGQAALARSESRYRRLVESAPLAIGVHRDEKLVFANPAAAALVGAPSSVDLMGRSVLDFVCPDFHDELVRETREARDAGRPTAPREVKLLALDGKVLDVELISIPFWDEAGPATQVLVRDITEQKQAEQGLRFLVEINDLLNASLDYETTLREVARLATLRLADWAAVDLFQPDGRLRRLVVVHQDPSKVHLAFEIARRYPQSEEGIARLRNGETFWFPEITDEMLGAGAKDPEHLTLIRALNLRSMMVVPLQARGEVLGALTFASAESGRVFSAADLDLAKEITARCAVAIDNARLYRRAEEQWLAAQAATEHIQFILRSARVGTWEWERASGAVRWSDTLEQIHGLPPGGFGGTFQDVQRRIHPEDTPKVLERIRDTIERGGDYEVEYRILSPSGVRWLAARGKVIQDAQGNTTGMTGVCTDVTEQKRAEESLQRQEERLRTLVEVSPIGIVILTVPGERVSFANPEAARIIGAPAKEGDPVTDLTQGVVFRRQDGTIYQHDELPGLRAGRTAERVRAERVNVEYPDGQVKPLLVSAAPFYGPEGNVTAVVLLLEDVTALTQNERLRHEFLSMVTHELRSPLVVIKSATAIAKEEMVTRALESPELLEAIDEQADRMLSLVANLLDMAQIEAGAFSIDPHPTSLREVVESAVHPLAAVSPVPIDLHIQADLPRVALDPQRIGQVVTNLVSNAVRFADPGTAVEAIAKWQDGSVVVAVRNQGPTIPPDKLPLLFRKFTRITPGNGPRAGGAGLGLSICKGIIEAHKGTIWAESIPASKETVFYFRLPLDGGDSSEERQRSGGSEAGSPEKDRSEGTRYHILAVDDEPMVLRYVQNLLRRTGYQVTTVADGLEAVEKVRESQPDLVLLDLMMPEISGFEVLERIRTFSDVPVIFLSASNRDEDKVQGLNLGADDYISKPFSTTELAARIAAVLRRKSSQG